MTTVPDLAEPVVGWRVWRLRGVVEGRPEIVSPVRPVPWPARRRMTAACDQGCPTVPTSRCGCGLYALADPPGLSPHTARHGQVMGCTALWGRVIEYTEGFRAEHGYPLVLFLRTDHRSTLRRLVRTREGLPDLPDDRRSTGLLARDLAARYAVPVGVVTDLVPPSWRVGVPAARALALEATRGLAARRAGDLTAHERLAEAAQALVGRIEWQVPAP